MRHLHKKHIIPRWPAARPRIDARQVQPVRLEDRERLRQRAGVIVRDCEGDEGLVGFAVAVAAWTWTLLVRGLQWRWCLRRCWRRDERV